RRLLEAGVPLVTVYWHYEGPEDSPGWDTHEKNYPHLRKRLLPPTDRAVSTFLEDLAVRGLLRDTPVLCYGAVRRTPPVQQGRRPRPLAARAVGAAGRGGGEGGERLRGDGRQRGQAGPRPGVAGRPDRHCAAPAGRAADDRGPRPRRPADGGVHGEGGGRCAGVSGGASPARRVASGGGEHSPDSPLYTSTSTFYCYTFQDCSLMLGD